MTKQLERKIISETSTYDIGRCSIDQCINVLEAFKISSKFSGFDTFEIEFWQEWDSAELRLIRSRRETDEEFEKRVAKSQKPKADKFAKFLKSIEKLNFASMPTSKQIATAKMIYDNLPSFKYLVGISVMLGEIEFNFASPVFSLDIWVHQGDSSVSYRGIGYNDDRTDHERFFNQDFDASKPLPEDLLKFISK